LSTVQVEGRTMDEEVFTCVCPLSRLREGRWTRKCSRDVQSCSYWLRDPAITPLSRIWVHIYEGRYWSAKIDDISL
jgi:hypothetical protein